MSFKDIFVERNRDSTQMRTMDIFRLLKSIHELKINYFLLTYRQSIIIKLSYHCIHISQLLFKCVNLKLFAYRYVAPIVGTIKKCFGRYTLQMHRQLRTIGRASGAAHLAQGKSGEMARGHSPLSFSIVRRAQTLSPRGERRARPAACRPPPAARLARESCNTFSVTSRIAYCHSF